MTNGLNRSETLRGALHKRVAACRWRDHHWWQAGSLPQITAAAAAVRLLSRMHSHQALRLLITVHLLQSCVSSGPKAAVPGQRGRPRSYSLLWRAASPLATPATGCKLAAGAAGCVLMFIRPSAVVRRLKGQRRGWLLLQ